MPRVSLVIPACNEEACLPRLLESVDRAWSAGAGPSRRGRGPYRYLSSIAFCSSSALNSGAAMSMSARARWRSVLP